MSRSARIAVLLLGIVPGWRVLALDPTLPQPGRKPSAAPAPSPPQASPAPSSTAQEPAPPGGASQPTATPEVTPLEKPAADRLPVPDAGQQSEAQKLVDQVYRDELLAARTPEAKKQVAAKLRQLAADSQPAGKYVLLVRSRELSADAGDVDTALGAVTDLERAFATDATALELDAVARLQRTLRTPESLRSVARHLLGSANQAVSGDRFDSARKLIDQAAIVVARANDPILSRLITARAREVREIESAYAAAKPALDAVATPSADPAAKLTAGRYLALYRGDFPTGVPLLAAGADDPLKQVATQEIAGVSGAEQLDALADGWYAIAEKQTGVAKNNAIVHAAGFYAQAAPSLAGLQQAKAIKRTKEAEPLAAMYAGRPGASNGTTAVTQTPSASPPAASPKPPTSADGSNVRINLPAKFVRVWKTPEVWANKPEDVTFKSGRVTITNAGGTVCENEPLVAQKDGSLTLTWDYGPDKTGYEVWSLKDGELVINRWNSKAELDSGRMVRRVGTMVK